MTSRALSVQTNTSTSRPFRRFSPSIPTQRPRVPNLRPQRLHHGPRDQAGCGARHTADARRSSRPSRRHPNTNTHTHHNRVQSDGLQLRARGVRVALQDLPDAASDLSPHSRLSVPRAPPPAPPCSSPHMSIEEEKTRTTHGTRHAVTSPPADAQALTNTATTPFLRSLESSAPAAGPVHPKLTNSDATHHARGPS